MATDPYEPPEIIALAQSIADEFGVGLRVEGWIGSTGHQGREFAINLNGQHCALELSERDILDFESDQRARMRVEGTHSAPIENDLQRFLVPMRYRLRTLLIVLALGPPLLARAWFTRGETVAAVGRMSPEVWVQLLGVAVAIIVIAVELHRRAKGSAAR